MIGPNFPQGSNLRPVVTGADPTMSAPGFFDQAAFPMLTPLSAGLLPMTPTGLTGGAPIAPGQSGQFMGIPLGKNGLPELSKKSQKDYLDNIIKNFMATSQQLQAGFSMFLGAPPRA